MKKEKYSKLFIFVVALSLTTLFISNICSVKIFKIFNFVLPTSALLFPISYILGDVISEVYGFKKAKFVILLGFACNAFMVLFFQLSISLPCSETWDLQDSYSLILGTTPRLFIASLVAYLAGSISNAYVMNLIKKYTKEKLLFIRTIGSTLVGELLDTLLFVTIAFIGTVPEKIIITMILCQFCWKVSYEIIATPFTYYIINKFKKYEMENL